ncbi:MAG TPA: DUF5937 family protein [Solirubrobacteraceae bacterium]|nr:DUF5937 family protein [Solirubrobacteraceae bacterium]
MAEIVFDTAALTRVRFAISPTIEMAGSVRVLGNPGRHAVHMPWAVRTASLVGGLDLSTLHALQGSRSYSPDFIHPLPEGPLTSLDEDLAAMLATPPDQVRTEVLEAYPGERVPRVLDGFVTDPGAAVSRLDRLLRTYWQRAVAPHWARVRALLEHDVRYRARQMADGGLEALFADLDPRVSWSDGVLKVEKQSDEDGFLSPCMTRVIELDERGLLLIPSVFAWPKVLLVAADPWQPTVIYPARGVGMLWDGDALTPPDALARLLGRNRAAVLLALDSPRSTSELAGLLGVTSGGVSQQLSVLAQAGLVARQRVRRHVLYLRTSGGDTLVDVTSSAEALAQPAA